MSSRELVQAKTERNALAPFLHLPAELLIRITHYVAADYEDRLTCTKPGAGLLTHVCSALRSLLVDTPSLWARINLDWREDVLRRCLIRSQKSHALHVKGSLRFVESEFFHRSASAERQLFVECMPRTRSISMCIDADGAEDEFVARIQGGRAPELREVHIYA
jgi:hypothetical protein